MKLDRRLYTTRTFSFYTTGGGTIDKSVSGKLEQDFIVQKEKIYSSTESLKIKPLQFSIHAALGIQYNINPTLGAFIEPGAAFYFKDGSFKNTIRDEYRSISTYNWECAGIIKETSCSLLSILVSIG